MKPNTKVYIKGVPNRGKEVLDLLEKVYGGTNINSEKITGEIPWMEYFIDQEGNIQSDHPVEGEEVRLDEVPYIYVQGNPEKSKEILNYFKSIGINTEDYLCNNPNAIYCAESDKTLSSHHIQSIFATVIEMTYIEIEF